MPEHLDADGCSLRVQKHLVDHGTDQLFFVLDGQVSRVPTIRQTTQSGLCLVDGDARFVATRRKSSSIVGVRLFEGFESLVPVGFQSRRDEPIFRIDGFVSALRKVRFIAQSRELLFPLLAYRGGFFAMPTRELKSQVNRSVVQ